jgi:hypothetical protein
MNKFENLKAWFRVFKGSMFALVFFTLFLFAMKSENVAAVITCSVLLGAFFVLWVFIGMKGDRQAKLLGILCGIFFYIMMSGSSILSFLELFGKEPVWIPIFCFIVAIAGAGVMNLVGWLLSKKMNLPAKKRVM